MYIGHYAVALGAKKISPKLSLGTLFFAVMINDLIMSILMLFDIEHIRISPGFTAMFPLDLYDYPISHSLVTAFIWSISFAVVYYFIRRSIRDAFVICSVVFSHWMLDFITHTTDLPLFPGSGIKVGLGIWDNIALSVTIEGFLFAVGVFIYYRVTKTKDRIGSIVFWLLMVFLSFSWIAGIFAPPPPDAMTLAIGNQVQWLVIIIAFWIDRHRDSVNL